MAGILPAFHLLQVSDLVLAGGSQGWSSNDWRVQVDGVMGGQSSATLSFTQQEMNFEGEIVLEGGGFANVQTNMQTTDLSEYSGFWVEMGSLAPLSSSMRAPLGVEISVKDSKSSWRYAAAVAVPPANQKGDTVGLYLDKSAFTRASRSGWTCNPARYSDPNECFPDFTQINGMEIYVLFQGGAFDIQISSIAAVKDKKMSSFPAVTVSDSQVAPFMQKTIDSGAGLWNYGYQDLSLAVYGTALKIMSVAEGPSAEVKRLTCVTLEKAQEGSTSDMAWAMRRGIDAINAESSGDARPDESTYPEGVRGDWLDSSSSADESCSNLQPPSSSSSAESPEGGPSTSGGSSSSISGSTGTRGRSVASLIAGVVLGLISFRMRL